MSDNYFAALYAINVSDKIEKKAGLSYLSWAWAWAELKKVHPDSTFTVYENKDGWNYHTDGKTAWVKTGVTVSGLEHIEYLPVMNHQNKSIPLASVTSYDVNKTIQRSLTKAIGRHGLGLSVYAGEDLPEAGSDAPENPAPNEFVTTKNALIDWLQVSPPVFNDEWTKYANERIAAKDIDGMKTCIETAKKIAAKKGEK